MHVVAQSVGGGPGAEAEAVVICRAAVMVVAAAAVMLLVKVAVTDTITGAVTVLPTALEWLTPAGETPQATKFLPTNTPAIKSPARPPQVDPGRGPDTKLVWRI